MNPWQWTKQLVHTLSPAQLVWAEGAGGAVLGAVMGTPLPPEFWNSSTGSPFAAVRLDGTRAHPQRPDFILEATYVVTLYSARVKDAVLGQTSVVGTTRTGGIGSSAGRGVQELDARVRAAIHALRLSTRARVTACEGIDSRDAPGPGVVALISLRVTVGRLPTEPYYHPCRNLLTSVAGGNVTLTWAVPPSTRFDRFGVRLARAAGAVAPSSTNGTVLIAPSAGAGLATYVDTPGSGTWSYALHAAYDEVAEGAVNRFSVALTKNSVVV